MLTVTTPAATSDLTTLAAVKAELQITGTASDTALAGLITSASAAIAGHTGHVWGRETVQQTERLTERSRWCIILDRPLAPAVSLVTEDGIDLADSDWELDGSLLYRLIDDRPRAWIAAKVVVTYQAGYTLPAGAPGDVQRAAVLTVSAWFQATGRDPLLRSETTEGVASTSWMANADTGALPPQALALLSDGGHVRIGVA